MSEAAHVRTNGSRLEAMAHLAVEADAAHLAAEAEALSERVREGRFYVACVGQFKRGKSTLLNALVGEQVLPTGVVPVTAVVTVVRHGDREGARVRFAAGGWQEIPPADLAQFVAEEQNPENRKGVTAVEVLVPHPLLASGMCLVDTPGIGSVFEGNTEATRAFVPHVDAALVVLGADPPISADELALVGEIAKQCQDLVFVLNKADKLAGVERDEATAFTRRVLSERLGRRDALVFEVSAAERLAGNGPERGWPGLVDALATLARESGSDLARAAEERGLALIADRLRHHLDEARGALVRPVEESERRVESLRACTVEAEHALHELGFLFDAEEARIGRILTNRTKEFLGRAIPAASGELADAIRAVDARRGAVLRSRAFELADEIARRHLTAWRAEAQATGEALYIEATQRFVDLANGFLERLSGAGDAALAGLPRALSPEKGFRWRSRLYFTSLITMTTPSLLEWFLERFRSRERQLVVLDRQIGEYLGSLFISNAARIRDDFNDRVLESRRRFLSEIRAAMTEVVSSSERALSRAKERRAQGSEAVRAEVERIDTLSERLGALGKERKVGMP